VQLESCSLDALVAKIKGMKTVENCQELFDASSYLFGESKFLATTLDSLVAEVKALLWREQYPEASNLLKQAQVLRSLDWNFVNSKLDLATGLAASHARVHFNNVMECCVSSSQLARLEEDCRDALHSLAQMESAFGPGSEAGEVYRRARDYYDK